MYTFLILHVLFYTESHKIYIFIRNPELYKTPNLILTGATYLHSLCKVPIEQFKIINIDTIVIIYYLSQNLRGTVRY